MLALVLVSPAPASAANLACGQTVLVSTVLDGDVGPCPAGGIVIGADNITLDLGGHQVSGSPGTGDGTGIRIAGRTGVTVTNGGVTNFDAGVVIEGGSRNTVSRLRVNDNIGPESGSGGPGDGIVVSRSNDNLVTENQVIHNGPFSGISVISSSRNTVSRNQVAANDVVRPGSARIVSADSSETPGVWSLTGAMAVSRFGGTTTLLANGKVLAAGGRIGAAGGPSTATAEVFDPISGTWSPAGSMPDPRYSHSATLLADGRVLVAGGFTGDLTTNAQPVLNSAALYDPASNSWTATGSLNVRRAIHMAILLPNGKVLAAGGRTCSAPPTACNSDFVTGTAELYDPATGTWTPTGSMAGPRHTTSVVLLPNGTVLFSGGFPGSGLDTAEIYNPSTGTFSPTGSLNFGRSRQGTVLLPDGQVLVASGFSGRGTAELYNPATGTFTFTGSTLGTQRFNFYFTALPDGRVLIAGGGGGGTNGTTSQVYDPATGSWQEAGQLNVSRANTSSNANSFNAVVLSSDPNRFAIDPAVCGNNCGKVLITGNSANTRAELFTALPGVRQGVGIWLLNADPGSPATGNVVDSNQVQGMDGIQVSTFSDGNTVRNNQVVANGFAQPSGSPDRDGDGIAVFGNRNAIEANIVYSNAGNGISIRFSTTRAGAPAGGLENRIVGNRAVGNDAKPNHVTAYDLVDTTPNCDANVWSANGFGTAFPNCARTP